MISGIVPVYNNEKTITRVIKTLLSCQDIDEIIVIDDCSEDNSVQKIKAFGSKIKTVFNNRNLGKGGAVVKGIKITKGNTILMCDADLSKIKKHHITNLINEYKCGRYNMVIAARESDKGLGAFMAIISGERIFEKKLIKPYLKFITESGNGIEQIINFAHRNKKVKIIISKNIGHVLKAQRGNLEKILLSYTQETAQLLKTDLMIKKINLNRLKKTFLKG